MKARAEWEGDQESGRGVRGLEGTEGGAKLYLDYFLLVPRLEAMSV